VAGQNLDSFCSRCSIEARERIFGTASTARLWLLLEYNGPWSRDLLAARDLVLGSDKVLRMLPDLKAQCYRIGSDRQEVVETIRSRLGKQKMVGKTNEKGGGYDENKPAANALRWIGNRFPAEVRADNASARLWHRASRPESPLHLPSPRSVRAKRPRCTPGRITFTVWPAF